MRDDYILTIKEPDIRKQAESLLEKQDIVFSLSAPETETPYSLWVWKDIMKVWVSKECRWVNVGKYLGDRGTGPRVANGLVRVKG